MDKPINPTPEAIEAAISAACRMIETEGAPEDFTSWKDLFLSNEYLKSALLGFAVGAATDDPQQQEELSNSPEADELLHRIYVFAILFFKVGWEARGAIEDAQQLQKDLDIE